jgi:hypothetical protein
MGRLEEKNRSSTFVLTAFISFGLFNVFPTNVHQLTPLEYKKFLEFTERDTQYPQQHS